MMPHLAPYRLDNAIHLPIKPQTEGAVKRFSFSSGN